MCGSQPCSDCDAPVLVPTVTNLAPLIAEDAQRPLGFSRLMRAEGLRHQLTPGDERSRQRALIFHNELPSLTAAVMSDTNNMEESNARQLARPA
jgi:hypothetical protein